MKKHLYATDLDTALFYSTMGCCMTSSQLDEKKHQLFMSPTQEFPSCWDFTQLVTVTLTLP